MIKHHEGTSENRVNLMALHKSATEASESASRTIDVMPTKELFIDMLTRDIALVPAITDLVDNCADGAKNIRASGSFKGLWARVEISPAEFRIVDNCGGIAIEVAEKYAFRFGRPKGAPSVKHSVGQFGVGMKRAIFKLGRHFNIESKTATSRFVVDVNVVAWAANPLWQFPFQDLQEGLHIEKAQTGTTIVVTQLQTDVAEAFGLENFETELRNELQARLQDPIAKGLAVTLNQVPVSAEPLTILADPRLTPAYRRLRFPERGPAPVTVKLYCGLGKSEDRAEAGWHVFCNGRLILEGDKTSVTGWGDETDGIAIPGFHGQYNHLRGYAYFDADDPGKLPWNTTKTGLNTDSAIYRAAKIEMMKLMRPVVDFLNRLKSEKDQKNDTGEAGPLELMIEGARTASLDNSRTREAFTLPQTKRTASALSGPTMQKIAYERPYSKVVKAKKKLNVTSYRAVGEATFDYFFKAEVEE